MRAPGETRKTARAGFTLIELVFTLVIVGVLAVFMITSISNTPASVVAEADILRAHIRFSQAMAMANNTSTWGLQFGGTSYTLLRDGQPAPLNLPHENSPTHTMAPGVTVAGPGLVLFDEWGDPGGTVQFTLSKGSHAETVMITAFTGLVP
jgi:prepilin-type N-terminal cleavage/methylation domain-containing protein